MGKINKVIKFEDLPKDAIKAMAKQYPEGWKAYIRKITKPNGEYFHAINVEKTEFCDPSESSLRERTRHSAHHRSSGEGADFLCTASRSSAR